jgi:hypothetical protein
MEFYGVQGACKIAFYNKTDNKLALYFPSANSLGISVSGETKEALAAGVTAITWSANRKMSIKLDTQLISPRLLTLILGAVETTEVNGNFAVFETGKIDSATATYSLGSAPAVGTLSCFITEADGKTVKTELTVAAGATPLVGEYKISGQTITVDASYKGQPILCIYAKAGTNITRLAIKADTYASPYKMVCLGTVRQESGVDKLVEITVPTLTAQSNMDLTYDSQNPSSFSFTFDVSKDAVTNEMLIQRFL